jgi:NitT/TauT family transport system permease protein
MRRWTASVVQWTVSLGIFVAAWQWLFAPHVNKLFFAPPSVVAQRLERWAGNGTLTSATWTTFSSMAVGLLIGSSIGVLLAACRIWAPFAQETVEPFVLSVYAIPKIAIAPAVILWFGRTNQSVPSLFFVALSSFAILYIAVSSDIAAIDPALARSLELLGATRGQITTKLVLPHVARATVTGLEVAAPFALVAALVIEMLEGRGGIGGLVVESSGIFDAGGVLAATVIATALALMLKVVSGVGRRRFASWTV